MSPALSSNTQPGIVLLSADRLGIERVAHWMACASWHPASLCFEKEAPAGRGCHLCAFSESCRTDQSSRFHRAEVSDMVGAGDYDYDDDHDLPAGCQYMDPQSFETDDASSEVTSAQAPGPAGADVSGHVSTPASAPGSAVNAKSAPGQATAPSAYTGRRAVLSASPTYTAPAPAPGIAPRERNICLCDGNCSAERQHH